MSLIGHWFGNYRALSLLGEGGMGAVYLAEHPGIGRRVAIKVLHEDLIRDRQHVQRFVNEARAANAIRHPNIVDILDSGTTDAGIPYLVMELLEGESLHDRLSRAPLPLAEALDIARQTASALHAAHRQGIVHRDLKPANLFLALDPRAEGRERVKVLDFGIAKLQTGSPADQVKTQTGMMLGTPTYMSPEQCRGVGPVGPRSDLYALGVILYEMVCGAPPFQSDAWAELIIMHIRQPPPSPRVRAPDLPAAVEAIILRALAKDPDDRFATMAELQVAIEAVAGSGSGSALPGGWARAGDPVPRPTAVLPDSAPRAPGHPTTMSESAGETSASRSSQADRSGRVGGWLLAGALVAIVAASSFILRPGQVDPPPTSATPAPPPLEEVTLPPKAPPPPPPRTVELGIETQPAGAQVIRASDGATLGTTPFRATFPAAEDTIELRLERPGYEPVRRLVPLSRDREEVITLSPKRPPRPRPRPKQGGTQQPEEPAKL